MTGKAGTCTRACLCKCRVGLTALGHEVSAPAGALAPIQLIHERFTYEPNATSVVTPRGAGRTARRLLRLRPRDDRHLPIPRPGGTATSAATCSRSCIRPTQTGRRRRLTRFGPGLAPDPRLGHARPTNAVPPAPTTSRSRGAGICRCEAAERRDQGGKEGAADGGDDGGAAGLINSNSSKLIPRTCWLA